MFVWQTNRFEIDLSRPKVMGVVNVTPDSFSDGGEHFEIQSAIKHCDQLLLEGADILDIGGESSRPGALALSLEVELARVIPVVRYAVTLGVPVSVDTYKPAVMQAVLDLGADIINDIWALRWSEPKGLVSALDVVSAFDHCGVCLMHMHRDPQTMQTTPMQGDVVAQVTEFLADRIQALERKGIARKRICIDPGIGFGKTVEQNFSLLSHQRGMLALGYPVIAGWSRKSSLGAVTGAPADDRVAASVAAAVLAVERGAHIVRVHDVKATIQGLQVLAAMQSAESKEKKNEETRQ
ncbi:MAG: dihydropteroate synthase [Comamonadaceae bacterium]